MNEFLHDVFAYGTPGAVFVAFIAACGAAILRQRYSLQNQNTRSRDRCMRLESSYRVAALYGRGLMETIVSMADLHTRGGCDDKYILIRVQEISREPLPFDSLDYFVKTGEELPQVGQVGESK